MKTCDQILQEGGAGGLFTIGIAAALLSNLAFGRAGVPSLVTLLTMPSSWLDPAAFNKKHKKSDNTEATLPSPDLPRPRALHLPAVAPTCHTLLVVKLVPRLFGEHVAGVTENCKRAQRRMQRVILL